MNITIVDRNGQRYAQAADGKLLYTVEDATDLVGFCLENGVNHLLLYAANLTDRFFDLSSGEAGLLLQKFRTYQIKVAVVWSPDQIPHSRRFEEMVAEENRGPAFRMYENRAAAEAWLLESDWPRA